MTVSAVQATVVDVGELMSVHMVVVSTAWISPLSVCSVTPIMLLDVCYDTECCVAYTDTCILPSCLHGCGYCSSPYHLLLHHRRLFTLTYWPFAARNRQRCVSGCGLRRACHLSSPPATDSAGLATGVHGEITVVNVPHYHCWCRLCCHPHG